MADIKIIGLTEGECHKVIAEASSADRRIECGNSFDEGVTIDYDRNSIVIDLSKIPKEITFLRVKFV